MTSRIASESVGTVRRLPGHAATRAGSVHEQVCEHAGLVGRERLDVAAEQHVADEDLGQGLHPGPGNELVVGVRAFLHHDLLVWDVTDVEQVLHRMTQRADLVAVDGDRAHDQSTSRSSSMPLTAAACTSWALPS